MTDLEANVAVAEAIGRPTPFHGRKVDDVYDAEKALDNQGLNYAYADNLYAQVVPADVQPFRATAAQRREAFLRTVGKWRDARNLLTTMRPSPQVHENNLAFMG